MGRRDYSRSPAASAGRNELNYDDGPEEDDSRRTRAYEDQEEYDYGGRPRGPADYDEKYDERDSRWDRREGRRYGGPPYEDSRRDYRRRRSESYSDGDRDGRGRSYSPGEYRHPGQPSDTVILEGLPTDVPVNELQSILYSSPILSSLNLVDIRIPPSGGKRRAFMQFHSAEEAIRFVDRNFPEIHVDIGSTSEGAPGRKSHLYVHFARSRDDDRRPTNDQWECPSCDFSNYSTRTRCKSCGFVQDSAPAYRQAPTGETDASNDASHFLVMYPMNVGVTEEVLEFGARQLEMVEKPQPRNGEKTSKPLKSTAPTGDTTGYGARRGSLHRIFLMRDKSTGQSLKFGFAEFWTVEDAVAALTKFRMSKNFTIGGSPVIISGIHTGVFVPEQREVTADTEKLSFVPVFNPALRIKYWDPYSYPNARIVNAEPPAAPDADAQKNADDKKSKKRKAESHLGSSVNKKPVAMAPQMAMWQKKHAEIHGDKVAESSNTSESNLDPETRSGPVSSGKPNPQGPIKISLGGMAKAVADPAPPPTTSSASPGPAPNNGAGSSQPTQKEKTEAMSYVDRERVCCLICMMKYKSLDDLDIHERSGNHKNAMANEDKVKAALPRLAARDKRMAKTSPQPETSQYRDRAKERREAFNQPKKPTPQASKPLKAGENKGPEAPTKPKESKGSALLAKMGWSGQGLGANGEGRTEVIETNAYAEGVGLGVEGANMGDAGKLAERRTKGGYQAYLDEAQEKARERYNRLQ